jgi:hypothetical protein
MTKQKTKLELIGVGSGKRAGPESHTLLAQPDKSSHAKYSVMIKSVSDNTLQIAGLTSCDVLAIVLANNTPPASRQISAPRGVTRFWGAENLITRAQAAIA